MANDSCRTILNEPHRLMCRQRRRQQLGRFDRLRRNEFRRTEKVRVGERCPWNSAVPWVGKWVGAGEQRPDQLDSKLRLVHLFCQTSGLNSPFSALGGIRTPNLLIRSQFGSVPVRPPASRIVPFSPLHEADLARS